MNIMDQTMQPQQKQEEQQQQQQQQLPQSDSLSSDKHKRKRGGGDDDDDDPSSFSSVSWDALLHPNFEQLARIYPAFGHAWRTVDGQRQAAIAAYQAQHKPPNVYMNKNSHSSSKHPHVPHNITALETYVTPEFALHLTRALLRQYWNLNLPSLPVNQHLTPPVPNRYFLVHWILHTLVPRCRTDNGKYFVQHQQEDASSLRTTTQIAGLDIGTGASCIYPLLACATSNELCHMYATDIDPVAIQHAAQNVQANPALANRIVPLHVPPSTVQQQQAQQEQAQAQQQEIDIAAFRGPYRQSVDAILHHHRQQQQHAPLPPLRQFTFCLTNPPFFDDTTDAQQPHRRDGRQRTPLTESEGRYPAGEVGFIRDMFIDQLVLFLSSRLQPPSNNNNNHHSLLVPAWTACMCGKKTSWTIVVHALQATLGMAHVDTATFGPGTQVRWFVAWTWHRPVVRSSLAAMTRWEFQVVLNNNATTMAFTSAIIRQRLNEYVAYKQDWNLQVLPDAKDDHTFHLAEQPDKIQWHDEDDHPNDDTQHQSSWLPAGAVNILAQWDPVARAQALLPPEGHFIVDITVHSNVAASSPSSSAVTITCHAYVHSLYGKRRVAHLHNQLAGEIAQTNRRWRRKLQQQQQQPPPPQQAPTAMDES